MKVLVFIVVLYLVLAVAWAQRLVRVTDPDGNEIDIAASAITKLRGHPKGGCVIYMSGSVQHVRETCTAIRKLMEK